MNNIQIYQLAIIGLGTSCSLITHGKPKEGSHDFRITFIGMVLALPIYGRIFGWW